VTRLRIDEERRVLTIVAALCLLVQVAAATFVVRDVESPNAAADIARTFVRRGEYVYQDAGSRAYHMPGEPLYLAAGFRTLPAPAWRYLHVPITVVLVAAVTETAFVLGGPVLALATGAVAGFEPFVVAHGSVWDDVFLAAALEWLVVAILFRTIGRHASTPRDRPRRRAIVWVAVAACAAAAALTRLQSALVMAGLGLLTIVSPRDTARRLGYAMLVGTVAALGAWGLRNQAVIGHFVLGSTHDGKALEESTGPNALAAIRRYGRANGSSAADVDRSDEFRADRQLEQIAWGYIASHKGAFLRTAALKLGVAAAGVDLGREPTSRRNLAGVGSGLVLCAAGPWGLWWLRSRARTVHLRSALGGLATITVAVAVVFSALGPVGLRYRFGLSLLLCLGTGATLQRVVSRIASKWSTASVRMLEP
jgi:hypothetical protein